jgi:hypothetical protein
LIFKGISLSIDRRKQHEFNDTHYCRTIPSQNNAGLPTPVPSVQSQLQNAIDSTLIQASSVASLGERLRTAGITTVITERGIKFAKDGVWFAGYQLGKAYTLNSLHQRLEQQTFVKAIAPIVAACLVDQIQRVGQHYTAYWEGEREQLVLMDNQRSHLQMRAINKEGAWEPVGLSKLTETDVRHLLQMDLRRRQMLVNDQAAVTQTRDR